MRKEREEGDREEEGGGENCVASKMWWCVPFYDPGIREAKVGELRAQGQGELCNKTLKSTNN